jgi:hypothetical protein
MDAGFVDIEGGAPRARGAYAPARLLKRSRNTLNGRYFPSVTILLHVFADRSWQVHEAGT